MEAASRLLHCTGADVGLEKARGGESGKSPPWCLSGTSATAREVLRASSGRSPERWSRESDGDPDAPARQCEKIPYKSADGSADLILAASLPSSGSGFARSQSGALGTQMSRGSCASR